MTKIKGAGEIMGFLEELYEHGYFPSENLKPEPTEEYKLAKERVAELYKQIAIKLDGEELIDAFVTAKADQVSIELATAFAEGTRFAGSMFFDCVKDK